jgi:hypothetical protein
MPRQCKCPLPLKRRPSGVHVEQLEDRCLLHGGLLAGLVPSAVPLLTPGPATATISNPVNAPVLAAPAASSSLGPASLSGPSGHLLPGGSTGGTVSTAVSTTVNAAGIGSSVGAVLDVSVGGTASQQGVGGAVNLTTHVGLAVGGAQPAGPAVGAATGQEGGSGGIGVGLSTQITAAGASVASAGVQLELASVPASGGGTASLGAGNSDLGVGLSAKVTVGVGLGTSGGDGAGAGQGNPGSSNAEGGVADSGIGGAGLHGIGEIPSPGNGVDVGISVATGSESGSATLTISSDADPTAGAGPSAGGERTRPGQGLSADPPSSGISEGGSLAGLGLFNGGADSAGSRGSMLDNGARPAAAARGSLQENPSIPINPDASDSSMPAGRALPTEPARPPDPPGVLNGEVVARVFADPLLFGAGDTTGDWWDAAPVEPAALPGPQGPTSVVGAVQGAPLAAPKGDLPEGEPAGLLATAPLDPHSLEAALQHFLDQLQALQGELSGLLARLPSTPWFVTLGALALACEVGRRRLRRTASRSALAGGGRSLTWLPNLSGPGSEEV